MVYMIYYTLYTDILHTIYHLAQFCVLSPLVVVVQIHMYISMSCTLFKQIYCYSFIVIHFKHFCSF